jgi:transcriptional regulator with XRE-family HTH domain
LSLFIFNIEVLKRRRNDIILTQCGLNIKRLRIQNNLSQEEISSMLNMDFSQYGKIERGKINITISTLYDIAQALNVQPSDLLT